jgi:hypothetical protein
MLMDDLERAVSLSNSHAAIHGAERQLIVASGRRGPGDPRLGFESHAGRILLGVMNPQPRIIVVSEHNESAGRMP